MYCLYSLEIPTINMKLVGRVECVLSIFPFSTCQQFATKAQFIVTLVQIDSLIMWLYSEKICAEEWGGDNNG